MDDKENKKKLKEEKKKMKEEKKKNRKKIDKMQVATKIIAALMAVFMVVGIGATFIYYIIRMF